MMRCAVGDGCNRHAPHPNLLPQWENVNLTGSVDGLRGTRVVVLASTSPRRRELIGALGIEVLLADPGVAEEEPRLGEAGEAYVRRLSVEKAVSASESNLPAVVIAADTAVVLGEEVLGKPADKGEAREMLMRLRGRPHMVMTGVTVLDGAAGRRHSVVEVSEVEMRAYSEREIREYVESGEPMDKAGAYGVQDRRFRPAEAVNGCYSNVVGLPLCRLAELLSRVGVKVSPHPAASCDRCSPGVVVEACNP